MNFDKLFEAFEYGSFGAPDEIKTYVDKETGRITSSLRTVISLTIFRMTWGRTST